MKGKEAILSFIPEHRMMEGIISGTPKPGVFMTKQTTAPVGGRFTYAAWNPGTGDGSPGTLYFLDIDHLQGKTYDDAYVSGTMGRMAILSAGDEVNARKADIAGTGTATEDLVIGQKLLIVDGTGKISPVAVGIAYAGAQPGPVFPLESNETLVDQPAEMGVWCTVRNIG